MAEAGMYNFTKGVQLKILAALWRDQHAFNLYREVVKPKYFNGSILIDICRVLFDYYATYNQSPTLDALTQEVVDLCKSSKRKEAVQEEYLDTLEYLSEIPLEDLDYIKDKIIAFGKRQALVDSIMEASVILDKEPEAQYPKIQKLVKDALLVGENVYDLGTNIYENIEERFLSYLNDEDVIERIPTDIEALDLCLGGGLGRTEMGVIVAPPGRGKALLPSTPVLTPSGYRLIGDLKVGDKVISVDGQPTIVTGVFPHNSKHMYKVKFMYGGECICCDEHLWTVQSQNSNEWVTMQLKDMVLDQNTYNIPVMNAPVVFDTQGDLPIHPWVLGAWIGNGCGIGTNCSFNNKQEDVIQKFNELLPDGLEARAQSAHPVEHFIAWKKDISGGYHKKPFKVYLKALGLWDKRKHEKFIPKVYLYASPEERLQLMQGLMDTGSHIQKRGMLVYSTTSHQLAEDVRFLALGLGCLTSDIKTAYANTLKNGETHTTYHLGIYPGEQSVLTSKKLLDQWNPEPLPKRYIESVDYIGDMPAVCISVEHPSQLYVIKDAIVTHNTTALITIGAAALENGYNVLHVSLENNEKQITRNYDLRLLKHNMEYVRENMDQSIQAMFNIQKYKRGELRIKKYPTRGATVQTIRSLMDRYKLVQGFVPDVVLVDYGTILKSSINYADKRNAIESNFEELRAMADDYNIALWSAAQGNRGALSKKIVTMSDLAECFAIGNICDVMVCLCQTMQEKIRQEMRMYLPKIRDNADSMVLKGKIMYDIKKIDMYEQIAASEQGNTDKDDDEAVEDWDADAKDD